MSGSSINVPMDRCPLCGAANECQLATVAPYKGPCWCQQVEVDAEAIAKVPVNVRGTACLCQRCLETPAANAGGATADGACATPTDYYTDELGRVVFTAEYLRSRGWCCGNGCRHCPY